MQATCGFKKSTGIKNAKTVQNNSFSKVLKYRPQTLGYRRKICCSCQRQSYFAGTFLINYYMIPTRIPHTQVFRQFFEDWPLAEAHRLIGNLFESSTRDNLLAFSQGLKDIIAAAWELTGTGTHDYIINKDDQAAMGHRELLAETLSEREFLNPAKAFIPFFNYLLPEEWDDLLNTLLQGETSIKGNARAKMLLDKLADAAWLISVREG